MPLILGGVVSAIAAFVAGIVGFGFALLATPLFILLHFPLRFVVTANLLITLVTRASVGYRLRRSVDRRRSALLLIGALPGLYLGGRTLASVDQHAIRIAAGALVMVVSVLLARSPEQRKRVSGPTLPLVAGLAGGYLGTTTSMIGIPPALLLAGGRTPANTYFADLAAYAVGSASLGLIALAATGTLSGYAIYPAFVVWLPGILVANFIGTSLALVLDAGRFVILVLVTTFAAGALTVATA
jgi:uncharacterized membrane protein YfcA